MHNNFCPIQVVDLSNINRPNGGNHRNHSISISIEYRNKQIIKLNGAIIDSTISLIVVH